MNVMQQEKVRTALLSLDGISHLSEGEDLMGRIVSFSVSTESGNVCIDAEEVEFNEEGCNNQYYQLSPSAALNLAVALLRVLAAMESEVAL